MLEPTDETSATSSSDLDDAQAPEKTAKKAAKKPAKKAAKKAAAKSFKKVLTRTVAGPERPAGRKPASAKTAPVATGQERDLRVSVRFTQNEELLLQECAAREGLTVSAYLRKCVLDARMQSAAPFVGETRRVTHTASPRVDQLFETKGSPAGGWLARLRQRFLSSPIRYAERA